MCLWLWGPLSEAGFTGFKDFSGFDTRKMARLHEN